MDCQDMKDHFFTWNQANWTIFGEISMAKIKIHTKLSPKQERVKLLNHYSNSPDVKIYQEALSLINSTTQQYHKAFLILRYIRDMLVNLLDPQLLIMQMTIFRR
jgi:hypothetical protein